MKIKYWLFVWSDTKWRKIYEDFDTEEEVLQEIRKREKGNIWGYWKIEKVYLT